jgi:hypothetical protein
MPFGMQAVYREDQILKTGIRAVFGQFEGATQKWASGPADARAASGSIVMSGSAISRGSAPSGSVGPI